MKIITQNSHRYLQFEKLLPFQKVLHASFQKHGELSFEAVKETIGIKNAAWATQVHGNHIAHIEHAGHARDADALVTNQPGIALFIKHADCQAALIYDPIQHVAAAVHCGWRGMTQKIYTKTLNFMNDTFSSKMQDLIVCISPSLGPHASQFIHYEKEFPIAFHAYRQGTDNFDLWQISKDELISAGISEHNIEIAKICTYNHPSDYFSYRYDKTSERLISVIALL